MLYTSFCPLGLIFRHHGHLYPLFVSRHPLKRRKKSQPPNHLASQQNVNPSPKTPVQHPQRNLANPPLHLHQDHPPLSNTPAPKSPPHPPLLLPPAPLLHPRAAALNTPIHPARSNSASTNSPPLPAEPAISTKSTDSSKSQPKSSIALPHKWLQGMRRRQRF